MRTDTCYALGAIKSEAIKYAGWYKEKNPLQHYEVKEIKDPLSDGLGWHACEN